MMSRQGGSNGKMRDKRDKNGVLTGEKISRDEDIRGSVVQAVSTLTFLTNFHYSSSNNLLAAMTKCAGPSPSIWPSTTRRASGSLWRTPVCTNLTTAMPSSLCQWSWLPTRATSSAAGCTSPSSETTTARTITVDTDREITLKILTC